MKNKFIKIFILVFASILVTNAAELNLNLIWISKLADNSVKLNFDNTIASTWSVSWDVKLFKDVEVVSSVKDPNFPNKIDLKLSKDLKPGNTYNIFSVFWTDWNADFKVEDWLKITFLTQEKDVKWISKVELVDSKSLVVYFKDSLVWNDFEFKVLENMSIKDLWNDAWSLIINTNSKLESAVKYLLMIMSLTDDKGNAYKLNDTVFDFSILQDNSISFVPGTFSENTTNATTTATPNTENNIELTSAWENTNTWIELNSWSENWTWNLENVAMEAKQTPNTWASTWIILAFTLIITSIFLMTRKSA